MAGESQVQAIGEMLTWLEAQVRGAREDFTQAMQHVEGLRRQIHDIQEEVDLATRATREIDPKLQPYRGLPEKIRGLDESTEQIRQQMTSAQAATDNAIRLIRAEADYDRQERTEAFKRIEAANQQLGLLLADIAQVQSQASQISQSSQTVMERQREIEARVEQFGLRLDRSIEVNRDLEQRILQVLTADQDDRFEVVYERLQVVGEMVRRNEDLIRAATSEQTLREEVLGEIRLWREEHNRIDSRLNSLEEATDRLLGQVDKVGGEIALLEGRHAGLGERVAGIRRDIAEVVDHVREEFAKYNQMMEKQRRKQIQGLEQELREMKFHAFRPPDEP